MNEPFIPKAADIMTRNVLTLRPDISVIRAMRELVEKRISGAPVLNSKNELCGIVSEYDCLRVLTSGQFSSNSHDEDARVAEIMTTDVETISPELDLFGIAHRFLERPIRRLPVVENGKLVGLVSRRDVLRGVETMRASLRKPPQTESKPRGLYLSASDPHGDEISSRLK